MHYGNGRVAKNGDTIVFLGAYGVPAVGVLFNATAGNDACNGSLAPINYGVSMPNLAECLHVDDLKAVLKNLTVPDTTPKPVEG